VVNGDVEGGVDILDGKVVLVFEDYDRHFSWNAVCKANNMVAAWINWA
jgi:hypothetical protein